jgi:hypothetical protein
MVRMRMNHFVVSVAAALSLLSSAGCEEQGPAPVDAQFVLRVDDSIFLGVVVSEGKVEAYPCDGDESSASVGAWLRGAHTDGAFDIEHEAGELRLVGSFTEDTLDATLTLKDGRSFEISGAAGLSEDDGLYWAAAGDYEGGWVVKDGEVRGAVIHRPTSTLSGGGSFSTSLEPLMVGGVTLQPQLLLAPSS